jgi:CBS domain-containing protein
MDRGKFRTLPVLEDGALIGIVTDRDLRKHEGPAGKATGVSRRDERNHSDDAKANNRLAGVLGYRCRTITRGAQDRWSSGDQRGQIGWDIDNERFAPRVVNAKISLKE